MFMNRALLSVIFLIAMVAAASSQGYMGTVTTGTGIIPAITVGSGKYSGTSVGAVSSLVNLTGSWSVDLKDQTARHLELQIFQDGDLMVGSGEMTAEGSSQKVTAAGSMTADRAMLFVSLIDSQQTYRLELASSGMSLSGEYDALNAAGLRSTGTATGSIISTAGSRQATVLGQGVNPSATSGAFVGNAVKSLDEASSSSERLTTSRSFYQTSNGQTTTTYDGNTATSSYSNS